MGKGSGAPAAPNYGAVANAQTGANMQSALANSLFSRPNEVTPLGSRTWEQTGKYTIPGQDIPGVSYTPPQDIPTFTSQTQLSPEGQKIFGGQLQQSMGMTDLANQSLGQTQQSLGQPFNMGDVQGIANQAYGAQTARLDPQWQQNQTSEETKLINQGLRPGDEAYNNAMRVFNQGKNDAYSQARLNAIQTMPQTFQLGQAGRELPLNELNALRGGSQVQMPQFQAYGGGQVQPTNLLGAAQQQQNAALQQYGIETGAQNALMQGLFSMGANAIPLLPFA